MTYNYDLFVIGAGPAGLSAAKRAATYGVNVAIAEQENLGGVCANRGCIPKKLMVYAADVAESIRAAKGYGWDLEAGQFHWQQFVAARDREVDRLRQVQADALSKAGISVLQGHARFVDAHTIAVGDRQCTANIVLIAVGGIPAKPKIAGIEHTITSREIFYLDQLPQRLAVIGGGYIGVEFASMMRGFGVDVTLMNHEGCILSGFDDDVRVAVQEGLIRRGIDILCETTAAQIESTADGLRLTLSGDNAKTLTADTVLCATGRWPNLDGLGLEQAGIDLQEKGIAVDETDRTTQPNIFAVGDCANKLQLTPVARAAGRAVVDRVFGNQPRALDLDHIPTAVYARPEMASIGLSEAKACEKFGKDAIRCYRKSFHHLFDRLSHSPEETLLKLVVNRNSDQILGVHIAGKEAAEIIQGFSLAVKQGMTKAQLNDAIGIHPSSAEELFLLT